jgi:hypothetical protein
MPHSSKAAPQTEPKSRSLRAVSRLRELAAEELSAALSEAEHSSSDRSAVIILASLLESDLERAIIVRFQNADKATIGLLTERDGALSSFYSKINLGYAMGLFGSAEQQEFDTIRRIRNAFAHSSYPLTLKSAEVSTELKKLGKISLRNPPDFGKMSKERSRFARQILALTEVIVQSMRAYSDEMDRKIKSLELLNESLEEERATGKKLASDTPR